MAINRRIGNVKKVKKYLIEDTEPRQKVLKPSKYTKTKEVQKSSIATLLTKQLQSCKDMRLSVPASSVDLMARMAAHKAYHTALYIRRRGDLSTRSIRVLVDLYLLSSLLYYQADFSVMPDVSYDRLCKYLCTRYEDIDKGYNILNNVSLETLQCGSGYDVKGSVFHSYVADYLYDFYKENDNDAIRKRSGKKAKVQKPQKFLSKPSQRIDRSVSRMRRGVDKYGQHYETFTSSTRTKEKIRLRPVRGTRP